MGRLTDNIIIMGLFDKLFELASGSFYGGSIDPAVITADSKSSPASGSVPSINASGILGLIPGFASLFSHSSGGTRSADYLSRMLNEFIMNPERSLSKYNKNTDLNNMFFQNMIAGMTGSSLTGSQIEQNQFNAEQAQLSRDWQEYMSSTTFQRTTADMKAAGLNPAMMYGGSASPASTPSSSPASGSASPMAGISAIAELLNAASSARLARSSSSLNDAQVFRTMAETDYINKKSETESERPELIRAQIEQARSRAALDLERADSEDERRILMVSQSLLNRINGENIEELRPYIQAELSARSKEERASAALKGWQAMYEKGIVNSDFIRQTVRKLAADADESTQDAIAQRLNNALRTNNPKEIYGDDSFGSKLMVALERTFNMFPFSSSYVNVSK